MRSANRNSGGVTRRTFAPPLQSKPHPKAKAHFTVIQPIRKFCNRTVRIFIRTTRILFRIGAEQKGKRGHSQVRSYDHHRPQLSLYRKRTHSLGSAIWKSDFDCTRFSWIHSWLVLPSNFHCYIFLGWAKQLQCWFHFHSYKKLVSFPIRN